MSLPLGIEAQFGTWLDRRPLLVAIAGSNGAGKTTFYESRLAQTGLRLVNADRIAVALGVDPYRAAAMADQLRRVLVHERESFIFETVFSDPQGAKLAFLAEAASAGFAVVLIFIGIAGVDRSSERVAMRVSQGGHDVPAEKLVQRFPRTLVNLAAALTSVPAVFIYDNDDSQWPFRLVQIHEQGQRRWRSATAPPWVPA